MAADPRDDPRAEDLLSADPGVLGELVSVFHTVATQAHTTAAGLRGAADDVAWTGASATAFRQGLGRVPAALGSVTVSYQEAGDALGAYESELTALKPAFRTIVAQLGTADIQLANAQNTRDSAQSALGAAQAKLNQSAITHPLSPLRTLPASSSLVTAVGVASTAVGNAHGDITALSTRGFHILDEFESARSTAQGRIVRATQIPPHQGFWDSVFGDIGDVMGGALHTLEDGAIGAWNAVVGTPSTIVNFAEHPSLANFEKLAVDVAVDASIVVAGYAAGGLLAGAAADAGDAAVAGGGALTVEEGTSLSSSEQRIANVLIEEGNQVLARAPTGVSRTPDFLVNGEPYDVYTPTTANVNRIVGAIASKSSQVRGGGVIVDLSQSPLTIEDLANVESRVRGITKRVSNVRVIP